MKRVLHIVNKWEKGGVERYIEGLATEISASEVVPSVLSICTDVTTGAPLNKYGPLVAGRGYFALLRGVLLMGAFLDAHTFDVAHIHASNASCCLIAYICERHGVPSRIVHSHSTSMSFETSKIKRSLNSMLLKLYAGHETLRIGCSSEAARALFGQKDSLVVPNGVDVDRFAFDAAERLALRKNLKIDEDCFVVLCVGSFVEVKNHLRSIRIFDHVQRVLQKSKLVMVGDGPLRPAIEDAVKKLNLSNKVIVAGFAEDVATWYSLADVMLFPSFYEGLPISLVEAQANGLPVVCSDTITREVGLLENCRFESLQAQDEVWARDLMSGVRVSSEAAAVKIRAMGFDKQSSIEKVKRAYGI